MTNYQTISVVPSFPSLLDKQKPWNTQLIEYIRPHREDRHCPPVSVVSNKTWCHWQVVASSIVQVTDDEFLNPAANHIPLVMGSQFGLQTGGLASSHRKNLQPVVV